MTAHELAKRLLQGPDLPVVINGWGSDESFGFEVGAIHEPESQWFWKHDPEMKISRQEQYDRKPEPAISLGY